MSYARTGDWTIDGDIRITADIAHGLEMLVALYIKQFGGTNEQDDAALKTITSVVADRLEDMSEEAKQYVETRSIEYRELERLAAIGREVELDRKFRQEEAAAVGDGTAVAASDARTLRRARAPAT